jgi:hypothetical protein
MISRGKANRRCGISFQTLTSRSRSICCALACATGAALCAIPVLAQPVGDLTTEDIEAAIRWGTQGSPAAYLLHHRSPDPAKVNAVIVGAVYTPFLRVALAAKAAEQKGHSFAVSDVPQSLIEPVAYIAVRWYCCVDHDHGDDLASWHPLVPFDYKIAVPGRDGFTESINRLSRLNLVTPLWVSRDLSILSTFGAESPYQDIVLIAAYPMSALKAEMDIVIYREFTAGNHHGRIQEDGRITAEDLARWR